MISMHITMLFQQLEVTLSVGAKAKIIADDDGFYPQCLYQYLVDEGFGGHGGKLLIEWQYQQVFRSMRCIHGIEQA